MQIPKSEKTEFTRGQYGYDSCDNLDGTNEMQTTIGVSSDSKVRKVDRYSSQFNQRNQRQLRASSMNMNSSGMTDETSTPECSFSDQSLLDE